MPDFPPIEVPGEGDLYARLHTTQGIILVRLEEHKAPRTVANFVGLVMGTIDWKDPLTGAAMKGTSLYSGVRFHRVIPNFMIQVGDPFSRSTEPKAQFRWGTGGPGYRFDDEIEPTLRHDRAGVLSMANAGPGTNGSQFFITERPTPHLDGRHTVFGYVVAGQEVVAKLARVERDARDCPEEEQLLSHVELLRSPTAPTA